jgi:hypothetical protein
MLEDFNPDPEELLEALQQGLNIHDGTALLDPATEIPRLQTLLSKKAVMESSHLAELQAQATAKHDDQRMRQMIREELGLVSSQPPVSQQAERQPLPSSSVPTGNAVEQTGVGNKAKSRRPKSRDSLYAQQVKAATPAKTRQWPDDPPMAPNPQGWSVPTWGSGNTGPAPAATPVQINVTGWDSRHHGTPAASSHVPPLQQRKALLAMPPQAPEVPASSSLNLSKVIGELSKLATFTGNQVEFKSWCNSLWRVAGVNDMEDALEPTYRPGTQGFDAKKNKVLYYLIEKAVEDSVVAHSHFKRAPRFDGNAAYFQLRDAYVFTSQAEAALLLQKLNGFHLQSGELLTTFCTRLEELFEDLESLEGENKMEFSTTQKLMYLLRAISTEPELAAAHVYLQSEMNRGTMTFQLAMRDLQLRCETRRADEALREAAPTPRGNRGRRAFVGLQQGPSTHTPAPAAPFKPTQEDWLALREFEQGEDVDTRLNTMGEQELRALLSTGNKRLNKIRSPSGAGPSNAADGTQCLIQGCSEICDLPVCRLHFASMVCGKTPSLPLRDNYGTVTYDKTTHQAVYPSAVPAAKLKRITRGKPRGGRTPSRA